MTQTGRCPMCEVKLSDHTSALGLCPACLLELGLSDPQPSPPAVGPVAPARSRNRSRLRTLLLAGLAVIFALLFYAFLRRPQPPHRALRFQIDPPPQTEFTASD